MHEQPRRVSDVAIDKLAKRVDELDGEVSQLKKAVSENTQITLKVKEDTEIIRDIFTTGRVINRLAVGIIPITVFFAALYGFWLWIKSQLKP